MGEGKEEQSSPLVEEMDDSDDDDDDLMNVEIPLAKAPPVMVQQKPLTDFVWNKTAIVDCFQLSLDAHKDGTVAEWQPPAASSVWKPSPVPLPAWAKPSSSFS